MKSEIVTSRKMYGGLLADCVSVFVGWPSKARVEESAVEAKPQKSDLATTVRTRLAFITCYCTGCLQ